MISKDSKISLSFSEAGESLSKLGVYKTAEVYVKNAFTKNEVFKINKPMQTIKRAEFTKSTRHITLGSAFVEKALEFPKKPEDTNYHRWLRTPLGRISQSWKKLSDEQKIKFHIEQYVFDMGGEDYKFEII